MAKIAIGVSSCLLGNKVRWKGDHKRKRAVTNYLNEYFEILPVCPEVEIGMGIPREPVNLEGDYNNPRMIGEFSRTDWTGEMTDFSKAKMKSLENIGISGFVLKKNSPSCGLSRIPVYGNIGRPPKKGIGLFARAITNRFENMPIVEEDFLDNVNQRKLFIVKVYLYNSIFVIRNNSWNLADIRKLFEPFVNIINNSKYLSAESELILKSTKDYNSDNFKHEIYTFIMSLINLKNASTVLKNIENNPHGNRLIAEKNS